MAQQSSAALVSQANSNLPDNTSQLISPADDRTQHIDNAESAWNKVDNPQVSGAEITAGTETAVRMYSPADIVDLIEAHGLEAFSLDDLSNVDETGKSTDDFLKWNGTSWVPAAIPGGGDMLASTYDPTSVSGDAFSMDNMVEGANTKILTSAERTTIGNTSGTNTGDEVAATESVAGIAEIATLAEVNTGTDDLRFITPNKLANSTLASNVTANNAKVSAGGSIDTHSDVDTTGKASGDFLKWNGTSWGAVTEDLTETVDADGDTGFESERTADQDTAWIKAGGSDKFEATASKIEMYDSGGSVLLNIYPDLRLGSAGSHINVKANPRTITMNQNTYNSFESTVNGTDKTVKIGDYDGDDVGTALEVDTVTDRITMTAGRVDLGKTDQTRYLQALLFDFDQAVTIGDGKYYLHIPPELNGMNLTYVHARVITAGTGATTDIQIHNVTDTVDMLSTKITIDSTEVGSDTAATPAVINTANDDVATNDLLRIDVDAVPGTAPEGLLVTLGFQNP